MVTETPWSECCTFTATLNETLTLQYIKNVKLIIEYCKDLFWYILCKPLMISDFSVCINLKNAFWRLHLVKFHLDFKSALSKRRLLSVWLISLMVEIYSQINFDITKFSISYIDYMGSNGRQKASVHWKIDLNWDIHWRHSLMWLQQL